MRTWTDDQILAILPVLSKAKQWLLAIKKKKSMLKENILNHCMPSDVFMFLFLLFYCMSNTGVVVCQLWVKRKLSESLFWKKTSLHCQIFWAWILFHIRAIYFELVFGNHLLNITVGGLWSKLQCEIISLIRVYKNFNQTRVRSKIITINLTEWAYSRRDPSTHCIARGH